LELQFVTAHRFTVNSTSSLRGTQTGCITLSFEQRSLHTCLSVIIRDFVAVQREQIAHVRRLGR